MDSIYCLWSPFVIFKCWWSTICWTDFL